MESPKECSWGLLLLQKKFSKNSQNRIWYGEIINIDLKSGIKLTFGNFFTKVQKFGRLTLKLESLKWK